MRIGIRTKFLLLITLLLVTIFGTITYFQIRNSTRNLRADLFDESKAFATLATQPIGNVFAIYKDSGTLKIQQQVSTFNELNHNIKNVIIVDVRGKVVYSQTDVGDFTITGDEAGTFEPIYKYNESGALSTVIYPYFEGSGSHRYSLVYSVSDEEIEKTIIKETWQLFYFGLASLLATMVLVYLLIDRFIIKPVQLVSEQAGVISAGNLSQQIVVHGKDEIASLGKSVNKMAESLKKSITELKEVDKVKTEFMMITSHNLLTPLSIMKGYLENLEMVMGDPVKMKDAFTKVGLSVRRLEVFAEDILSISRFELGDNNVLRERIKFVEFIDKVAEEFMPTSELKKQKFDKDIEESTAEVEISVPFIRSAVWNVLDNAAKFTPEGGSIKLQARQADNYAVIVISDSGIGISEAELGKLFTKFHRGTSTLTYDYEGTGIGLYASKMMIEKHGGTIGVVSQEGKGSTFTIRLPIAGDITPKSEA